MKMISDNLQFVFQKVFMNLLKSACFSSIQQKYCPHEWTKLFVTDMCENSRNFLIIIIPNDVCIIFLSLNVISCHKADVRLSM